MSFDTWGVEEVHTVKVVTSRLYLPEPHTSMKREYFREGILFLRKEWNEGNGGDICLEDYPRNGLWTWFHKDGTIKAKVFYRNDDVMR